jgi:hypothetical protein
MSSLNKFKPLGSGGPVSVSRFSSTLLKSSLSSVCRSVMKMARMGLSERWSRLLLLGGSLWAVAPAVLGTPDCKMPCTENWLLGQWARDMDGCQRPEFTFRADSVTIILDADGEPSSFVYPSARYKISDSHISVSLGKRHPIAKTPSKTELKYQLGQDGLAQLQLLKGRVTPYQRCPEKNEP